MVRIGSRLRGSDMVSFLLESRARQMFRGCPKRCEIQVILFTEISSVIPAQAGIH